LKHEEQARQEVIFIEIMVIKWRFACKDICLTLGLACG